MFLRRVPEQLARSLTAARMADRDVLMPPSGSDVAPAAAASAAGPDPLSPVPLTSRYHYLHTLTLCVAQEPANAEAFLSSIALFKKNDVCEEL